MRTHVSRRALMALATAVACIGIMATPASADDTLTGTTTAGTATVTTPGAGTHIFSLGGSGGSTPPCQYTSPGGSLTARFAPNATNPTSTTLTGVSAPKGFANITTGISQTGWYQIDLSLAPSPPFSQAGVVSGSAPNYSVSQQAAFVMQMYYLGANPNPNAPCDKTVLKCTAYLLFQGTRALTGTYNNGTRVATLSTGALAGTISASSSTCPPNDLRSQLNGASVAIAGLTVDFP